MVAQESKRLTTLDTYDGFRCDISKQLSPYMVAIHNYWLGTSMMPDGRKSTYAFVCQVADENGLLMARVDPGRGSVDGRIHTALLGGLAMGKLQLGLSAEGQQDHALAEVDFGGETWTGNMKYGSMGGGIAYGCNYFQAVTPRLAMGGEGMYLGVNGTLMSNYTLRYAMPAKTGEGCSVSKHPHPSCQGAFLVAFCPAPVPLCSLEHGLVYHVQHQTYHHLLQPSEDDPG